MAVGALADYYSSLFVFHMDDNAAAWEQAVDMAVSVHELLRDDEKQDIVDQAWGFLNDWVATNAGSFLNEDEINAIIPRPLYGSTKDEMVYAIVSSVNKALDDNGFPHGKCIQGFKERGYIELFEGTGKKDSTVVRTSTSRSFGGFRGRVYVFKIPDSFYDIPEAEKTPFGEDTREE